MSSQSQWNWVGVQPWQVEEGRGSEIAGRVAEVGGGQRRGNCAPQSLKTGDKYT